MKIFEKCCNDAMKKDFEKMENVNVKETINDLMVSLDKSAMPLAAVAADFYPFMLFHMRKFFENDQ